MESSIVFGVVVAHNNIFSREMFILSWKMSKSNNVFFSLLTSNYRMCCWNSLRQNNCKKRLKPQPNDKRHIYKSNLFGLIEFPCSKKHFCPFFAYVSRISEVNIKKKYSIWITIWFFVVTIVTSMAICQNSKTFRSSHSHSHTNFRKSYTRNVIDMT